MSGFYLTVMKHVTLIENECYICFDPCETLSPCLCNTYVHKKCLQIFLKKRSNGNTCMQCDQPYKFKKKSRILKCLKRVFLCR